MSFFFLGGGEGGSLYIAKAGWGAWSMGVHAVWGCTGVCSHTMQVQRLLAGMHVFDSASTLKYFDCNFFFLILF